MEVLCGLRGLRANLRAFIQAILPGTPAYMAPEAWAGNLTPKAGVLWKLSESGGFGGFGV